MDEHLLPPAHRERIAAYADQHNIHSTLQQLMQRLLVQKPVDPVQFMIEELSRAQTPKIVVLGPYDSQHLVRKISRELADRLSMPFLSSGQLVREAIEKQASLGLQAKVHVDSGARVPDNVINGLMAHHLGDPEVQEKGFVMQGYPESVDQLQAANLKGVFPTHYVVIKFEPSVGTETKATLANVDQKRVKKQEIHQKTMDKFLAAIKPSWANSEVASALHYREFSMSLLDEPSAVAGRLVESLVAECGVKVDAALGTTYSGRKLRGAPKMTKLAVVGPGASTACRSLSEKYGCVHVSVKNLRLGCESASVTDEQLAKLVVERVRKEDCVSNGFVLDGFPMNKAQAVALEQGGIKLNRVAVLSGGDQVVSGEAAIDAAALQASFGKLKGVQFHSIPLVKEQRHLFELLEDALIRG